LIAHDDPQKSLNFFPWSLVFPSKMLLLIDWFRGMTQMQVNQFLTEFISSCQEK